MRSTPGAKLMPMVMAQPTPMAVPMAAAHEPMPMARRHKVGPEGPEGPGGSRGSQRVQRV